jgi:hypothetical protein
VVIIHVIFKICLHEEIAVSKYAQKCFIARALVIIEVIIKTCLYGQIAASKMQKRVLL